MEACETREHGSDTKQNHQLEGSIMQAKEWTRTSGRCNPVAHAVTKQQRSMECAGENSSQMEQQGPQAGQPRPADLSLFYTPRCSPSASKSFAQFLVRVLQLIVQNHLRHRFPL
jgi:hypothetical protein